MIYKVSAKSGNRRRGMSIDVPTGNYALVCAMAVAQADLPIPCVVDIQCDAVMPEYGPYRYALENDPYGNLVIRAIT